MAKNKKQKSRRSAELDSTFVLKLVLYLILGNQWLFIVDGQGTWQLPLPIGFVLGLLFARHDHFQIDRKIEYALLLVASLVGFWAHIGLEFIS